MDAALVMLFKHNLWANLRLLDACAGLDEEILNAGAPGTFGKVGDTLDHIVGSESGYFYRLNTGQPKPSGVPNEVFPGIEELRERARRSGEGLIEVAGRFQPGEVFRVNWKDGNVYDIPAEVYLAQVITHATEHRSQVMTILTQLGIEPPDLSVWAYCEDAIILSRQHSAP